MPYLELATAYSKSDDTVDKVVNAHGQTFQEVSWTARKAGNAGSQR